MIFNNLQNYNREQLNNKIPVLHNELKKLNKIETLATIMILLL